MEGVFALPPVDYQASLRWADRLYAETAPLANAPGLDTIVDALVAYRQVENRWGAGEETRIKIARCLGLLGEFGQAVECLRGEPSAKSRAERGRLAELGWVQREATKGFGSGIAARQVLAIPSRPGTWLVLGGIERKGKEYPDWEPSIFEHARLALFKRSREGRLEVVGPIKALQVDEREAREARLTVGDLSGKGDYAGVVMFNYMAADSMPTHQRVYRIEADGLKWLWSFNGMGVTSQHRARDGRLVIRIEATWKVWWPDIYEWRSGKFVFANARYPELYDIKESPTPKWVLTSYPHLLREAALSCIAKRYVRADRFLRLAERACEISLREQKARNPDSDYYDAGFYGYAGENLKEIRLRRRLLRQRNYNQRILVRPYDFDLQVPPYVLGRARS